MTKKIFQIYMDESMHKRFKKMYDIKYNHKSFYGMFIDLALPMLEKFEREEEKK